MLPPHSPTIPVHDRWRGHASQPPIIIVVLQIPQIKNNTILLQLQHLRIIVRIRWRCICLSGSGTPDDRGMYHDWFAIKYYIVQCYYKRWGAWQCCIVQQAATWFILIVMGGRRKAGVRGSGSSSIGGGTVATWLDVLWCPNLISLRGLCNNQPRRVVPDAAPCLWHTRLCFVNRKPILVNGDAIYYLNSFGVATLILSTHYVGGRGTPDLGGEEVMGTYISEQGKRNDLPRLGP